VRCRECDTVWESGGERMSGGGGEGGRCCEWECECVYGGGGVEVRGGVAEEEEAVLSKPRIFSIFRPKLPTTQECV